MPRRKQTKGNAKQAVRQPRFRSRVEKPAKGRGSFRRKPKHPAPADSNS